MSPDDIREFGIRKPSRPCATWKHAAEPAVRRPLPGQMELPFGDERTEEDRKAVVAAAILGVLRDLPDENLDAHSLLSELRLRAATDFEPLRVLEVLWGLAADGRIRLTPGRKWKMVEPATAAK